jgi:site-specific DNA-methyltransferase (adenine-specific)
MTPLISYFRDARESLGVTSAQIAEATGKKNMVSHWFGLEPVATAEQTDYLKLQALFKNCHG